MAEESGKKSSIVTPPNLIKHKVQGRGGPSQEMLAKAESAISEMSDDYPNWAIEDVNQLGKLVEQTELGVGNGKQIMGEAFKLAHDMRGQGGSFGYPLMTRIAGSFCRFVENLEEIDQGAVDICAAHVKSMRAVLQNKVKGNGGPIGAQIGDGLEAAVKKYMDKLS